MQNEKVATFYMAVANSELKSKDGMPIQLLLESHWCFLLLQHQLPALLDH